MTKNHGISEYVSLTVTKGIVLHLYKYLSQEKKCVCNSCLLLF